ncbi:hypothetical protein [Nocardiopsis sp. CC223A]|uniref:hypothetical protein n=1 Tax=Nocardiopsis sp. CC223A TaxID=3044051 RepID=UPI00278C298F|nr:hypothetical protein [Nocardiopsis sp. CC223A]
MSAPVRDRFRAAVMVIAPVVLLTAFLYHPYVPGPAPTPEAIAPLVEADTAHWAMVHLLTIVAFALFVLAFQALRGLLRNAGEERWSSFAFPLVIVGLVLLAGLPAIEMAVAAAVQAGVDTVAMLEAVQPWFLTLLVSGSIAFVLGALAFAMGIARSGIMGRPMTAVVTAAVIVMAVAVAAPPFAFFYVLGVASIVAFWPLAWQAVRSGARTGTGTSAGAAGADRAAGTPTAPRPRAAEDRSALRNLVRWSQHH